MAAKKPMARSASAPSTAEPPPARPTSATAATTPNLAAVFTRKSVAPLADHAGGGEDQHDAAERHPVRHEDRGGMGHQVAQQEGDRRVAGHEGEQRGHCEPGPGATGRAGVPEL